MIVDDIKFKHIGTPEPCVVWREANPAPQRTFVIAGVPRGGTTMAAAVVYFLGVYLGPEEDLKDFTLEDQTLNQPYHDVQFRRIKENDAQHDVWGWKNPGAIHSLKETSYALRNPHLIVVFRDMLATVQGEMRVDADNDINRPPDVIVENHLDRIHENWRFILDSQLPTLLISYELAMRYPERLVEQMVSFLGITPSEEQRKAALEHIGPDGGYIVWK